MSYSMQAVNDLSEQGYWWFSIGGMAEMRDRMRDAHLLDDATPKSPRPAGDDAALQAWRRQTSPNPRQIPAWKFESNDGWLVTPEECALLAESLDSSDGPSTRYFVEYCAACINKGGFHVW